MACATRAVQIKGTAHSLLIVITLGKPAVRFGELPSEILARFSWAVVQTSHTTITTKRFSSDTHSNT